MAAAAAVDYSDNGISDYGDDDRSDHLPGFLFAPTDEQLLGFYLRRKTAGGGVAPAIDAIIPTLDIFGPRALPPWLLHPHTAAASSSSRHDIPPSVAPRHATDWFYCFAHITRRGPGSCRTTKSGTWVSNGKEKRVDRRNGETLGYKSTLAFRIPGEGGGVNSKGVGTGWVMHEFKIHGPERKKAAAIKGNLDGSNSYSDEAEQLVLCRIRFRCTKPTMEPNAAEGYRPDDGGEVDVSSRRPKRQRTRDGLPPESPGAGSGHTEPRCLQVEDPDIVATLASPDRCDVLKSTVTCINLPKDGTVLSVGETVEQLSHASEENMWDDIALGFNFSSLPQDDQGQFWELLELLLMAEGDHNQSPFSLGTLDARTGLM